ncbi:recombinase family protein [Microbacterium sp. 22303]|uniref:recombinase family protein n=1 Tax=Microbacterium sp. 22303 TaxID=3453905 RepID=UPI003F87A5E4
MNMQPTIPTTYGPTGATLGSSLDALLYGRASKDRKKLMRSIGDQLEECKSWCAPLNWNVAKIITDADRSASQWRRREREGWEEAIELIESGKYGAFVTWEPSRAGRDMEIYVQLRKACQKAGVLYMTHGRVYDFARSDDAFMIGFEFLRAEADANNMRERQLRTAKLNAERGRPHGRLSFGYRRVYDEHTGVLLRQEPDPHRGELVTMMAREVLAGTSPFKVANMLQDLGEPLPQGPREGHLDRGWGSLTVKQILSNPAIAGKRVYRGKVIGDAGWEPLVSEEDFTRLQKILYDPARRVHHHDGVTPKSLLACIATCHYCGRALVRTTNKNRSSTGGPRVARYHCRFRGCYKVMIASGWLDQFVEATVVAWLGTPENVAVLAAGDDDWAQRSAQAELRLVELQERLDEATDQFTAGAISASVLARIESTLRPQIEEAQRDAMPTIIDEGVRTVMSAEDVQAAWDGIDLQEKRRIVKLLFEIRIMQAPRRGPNNVQPERVVISPRVTDRGRMVEFSNDEVIATQPTAAA